MTASPTTGTAVASPVPDSDFRTAYLDGLEAIYFLQFCNPASSGDGSQVMERWWSLTQQAHQHGLSLEIAAAQKDHSAMQAVRRVITTCPEGLADRLRRTRPVLDKLEKLLTTQEEAG